MQKMYFHLNISNQNYQSYYSGVAKFVKVQAEDGRSLQFPASELQPFISHSGIQGKFEIVFNDNHKLVSLKQILK